MITPKSYQLNKSFTLHEWMEQFRTIKWINIEFSQSDR
jgi:hypothetical protein